MTDDMQIDLMKTNFQANGQSTIQQGNYYDFYKTVDTDDLLKEYMKRYTTKTSKSLVSYFRRYTDIFFGPGPDNELFKLKPHKRAWILQSMKRLGDYYFWKYNTREVQNLVKTIIERHWLNRDLDMKDRIYLVNPNYLQTKINALLAIAGEIGFTVRMGIFTGLREEELYYIHDRNICKNELGCKCDDIHPVNMDNRISVIGINWIRGNKKAFVPILPTTMWRRSSHNGWTKNIPVKKVMIISIHLKIFFKAKPIAYPRNPLPANGIILDNKTSLIIFILLLLSMF